MKYILDHYFFTNFFTVLFGGLPRGLLGGSVSSTYYYCLCISFNDGYCFRSSMIYYNSAYLLFFSIRSYASVSCSLNQAFFLSFSLFVPSLFSGGIIYMLEFNGVIFNIYLRLPSMQLARYVSFAFIKSKKSTSSFLLI